ncbi:hypothetical protein ElyMa_002012800 [Elysia marginata]|uniref:Uncharacterized protein n=1 Tax=Elysia marginata TaxID=1093978 RepID=A0AAV4F6I0_9GAST|nr:hypothetical protein ElyMa_002012800 [Elysia marginata]
MRKFLAVLLVVAMIGLALAEPELEKRFIRKTLKKAWKGIKTGSKKLYASYKDSDLRKKVKDVGKAGVKFVADKLGGGLDFLQGKLTSKTVGAVAAPATAVVTKGSR